MVYYPDDLKDMDGQTVLTELFGQAPETSYWISLDREDDKSFRWNDKRLGIDWRATNGYLVGLHEVSTIEEANEFIKKNRMFFFEDGGIYFRGKGVAELFIRCIGIPPPVEEKSEEDFFRIRTISGINASIGYGSLIFQRLVSGPMAEVNPIIPDPDTLVTLVISGVEKEAVPGQAELALFHFRKHFKGLRFSFWPLFEIDHAPKLEESPEELDEKRNVVDVEDTDRPEAIAFINRAEESEPIPAFLYYYRVLESCFDDVLKHRIEDWRKDIAIDSQTLLKKIRRLQSDREDRWSLRKVLGEIVEQKDLDNIKRAGLIREATANNLRDCIYLRRNSIAHGRKGQHRETLVPYGFSFGDAGHQDRAWLMYMRKFALKALDKWILKK